MLALALGTTVCSVSVRCQVISVQGVVGRQGQVRGGATLSLLYIATLLYCLYCTYSTYIYIHIIFYIYIYTYTWTYYCLYI